MTFADIRASNGVEVALRQENGSSTYRPESISPRPLVPLFDIALVVFYWHEPSSTSTALPFVRAKSSMPSPFKSPSASELATAG